MTEQNYNRAIDIVRRGYERLRDTVRDVFKKRIAELEEALEKAEDQLHYERSQMEPERDRLLESRDEEKRKRIEAEAARDIAEKALKVVTRDRDANLSRATSAENRLKRAGIDIVGEEQRATAAQRGRSDMGGPSFPARTPTDQPLGRYAPETQRGLTEGQRGTSGYGPTSLEGGFKNP